MFRIRIRRPITIAAMIATLALFHSRPAQAGPLPLEAAWAELDGPQPRGPGPVVLVNHTPTNGGGLGSDLLVMDFPGGYQRVADDFSLLGNAAINRVVWWGFYDLNVAPVVEEIFRIRFYDSRPSDSLPGSIIYERSFTNVPRTWTGRFIADSGAPHELRYEVDLPMSAQLLGSTQYWLEIVQVGDIDTIFRWEFSQNSSLNGQAYLNAITPNMDWQITFPTLVSNTAFQLITVPEPTSAVMSWTALAVVLFRRRRCCR